MHHVVNHSVQYSPDLGLRHGCNLLGIKQVTCDLKTWTAPVQPLNWIGMVAKRKKGKVEQQDEKAVTFILLFNWMHGILWYFPKKIQGKDHWESLQHRKAYWTFSFNIARTYLEIMATMMSCVLNIGTITITSNWFTKSKRHAWQTAIFQRHINENPKYKGESSSNGDLVMTEDGQYYSEGERIQSVTIHS